MKSNRSTKIFAIPAELLSYKSSLLLAVSSHVPSAVGPID